MATLTIDVENRSFVKQGPGPIVTAVAPDLKRPVSLAGTFSFLMPSADPMAAYLFNKKSVLRFFFDNREMFLGVVEGLVDDVPYDGRVWLEVSGRDLMGVEFSESLAYGAYDNNTIVPKLIKPGGGYGKPPLWGLVHRPGSAWVDYSSGAVTATAIYAKFVGEKMLSAYVRMAERINEGWVYLPETDGDRKVRWIGSYWEDSGVRAIQGAGEPVQAEGNEAICFIRSMKRTRDGYGIVNRVTPYGSGVGDARLTLAAATVSITGYTIDTANNTITSDDGFYVAGDQFFDIELEFKEVSALSNTDADLESAANYLARATVAWLARNDREQSYLEMSVMKLPATVQPGTTLRAVYEDESLDIDGVYNVVEVGLSMDDDGTVWPAVKIADGAQWMPSGSDVVAGTAEQGQIMIAHPQQNANLDTVSYSGVSFDNSTPANLFFVLGNAITQLSQVMLYYRVDPLRSEVQTVGGSASVAIDVTVPAHDHDIPEHNHLFRLTHIGGVTNKKNLVIDLDNIKVKYEDTDVGPVDADLNSSTIDPASTKTTTSDPGGTASGTVDLSSAITATYGLFEDSGGTVETTAGAAVAVNGTGVTGASFSGSWYAVDITAHLASATTRRPLATANTVTVTASSSKRGRVTAHIEIRSIIQAIAYT